MVTDKQLDAYLEEFPWSVVMRDLVRNYRRMRDQPNPRWRTKTQSHIVALAQKLRSRRG